MRITSALRLASVLSLGAVAVACGSSDPVGLAGADGGSKDPSSTGTTIVGGSDVDGGAVNVQDGACTKIDFLFVVDDSGSMSEEQQNLGSNFPRFVQAIETFRNKTGQALDYRLAVTTTGITHAIVIPPQMVGPFPVPGRTINETGKDGEFVQKSSCGMTRRWFEKGDSNLPSNFACAAKVGTDGPSFEMHLEGLKRALVDRVQDGKNAGFLRADALLAVVFLTDEDDCSTPLASFEAQNDSCVPPPPGLAGIPDYLTVLDTVKGGGAAGRSRWASAVIAGPSDCKSSFGSARTATRLLEFVRQAGSNAVFSSICSGDLAGALTQALGTFQAACNNFQPPR
jgi:hypothetical protein